MLLSLGEKQMLINLTFSTVKFPRDRHIRQTVRLFPKVKDRDWCAPDNLWCGRGREGSDLECFWFYYDHHYIQLYTPLCFHCPLSAPVLVRCKDPIQDPYLDISSTKGLGKGRLPHCYCEKSCLCPQTATIRLSHGCPKVMTPSSYTEDECTQSLTD